MSRARVIVCLSGNERFILYVVLSKFLCQCLFFVWDIPMLELGRQRFLVEHALWERRFELGVHAD